MKMRRGAQASGGVSGKVFGGAGAAPELEDAVAGLGEIVAELAGAEIDKNLCGAEQVGGGAGAGDGVLERFEMEGGENQDEHDGAEGRVEAPPAAPMRRSSQPRPVHLKMLAQMRPSRAPTA